MELRTPQEIQIMAEGGKHLGQILQELKKTVRPGITTLSLDKIAYDLIIKAGDTPAFLNYRPGGAVRAYPYTLCTSVNDVVVHGQPSTYILQEGDVIKLDLGLKHEGFYLDAAITVGVGDVDRSAKKLMDATEEALYAGIKQAKPGNTLGDVGFAIQSVVHKKGFSVVEGLTGHGIGKVLHDDPVVFNEGQKGRGERLVAGMVLAVEPMTSVGRGEIVQLKDEGYGTADLSVSAQFEHTVAITDRGPVILTKI